MFEYRLLPTPTASKKAKGLKTVPERFAHALTETLNNEAKNGWQFVGQESFSVEDKPGMMKKARTSELTYLVFKRAIEADAMPLEQKLADLKSKRARTIVQEATAEAAVAVPLMVAESAAATAPEPAIAPAPEPFPEPMPAYIPEEPEEIVATPEPVSEPVPDKPKIVSVTTEPPSASLAAERPTDTSQSLPFPGPAPAKTLGAGGAVSPQSESPTLNYDHSKGNTGASVDAPILGPAKRD